jgi:hypothetical protein
MTASTLIEYCLARLQTERRLVIETCQEAPIPVSQGRQLQTVGDLHLYEFMLPAGVSLPVDMAVTIAPADESEQTEGIVLGQTGQAVLVQVIDALGNPSPPVTLIPDLAGQLSLSIRRLEDMLTKVDAYNLGLAERLATLFKSGDAGGRTASPASSVLSTIWMEDRLLRRQRLAGLAMDLIRANKRILLLSPDHQEADVVTGIIARAMKAGGLSYKTWISRYEMPVLAESGGVGLQELGFEAQMHRFYAQSKAEKASLRRKYERFRELVPLMTYKAQKQKDVDEVRLLEWRLVTKLRDLQVKLAEVDTTLTQYETLPLFQRLAMQAVGKNVDSLKQYRVLYQRQIEGLHKEIDIAKARIQALAPEAAVSRHLRQECEDLKEAVTKLGGTKKIRELLAAEADPNRQAFLQNRRLVVATPARVARDPLFSRVRFDVLMADEAPLISAAQLAAAAGLVRERMVLSGDPKDTETSDRWTLDGANAPAAHPTPPALA